MDHLLSKPEVTMWKILQQELHNNKTIKMDHNLEKLANIKLCVTGKFCLEMKVDVCQQLLYIHVDKNPSLQEHVY